MPGADVASKACEESAGRGGDSFSVCLTPCAASLPPSFSLVDMDERQETRPDFVVMCDQTLVVVSHTLLPPSLPASLLSFSLVPTGVRQETRLDFVVMCDQTLVVLLLVVVGMIVVEESLVVGE